MKMIKILLLVCIFSPLSVFASTNTYIRTNDKPLVPDDVVITDMNRQEILRTAAVSSNEKIYDFAEVLSDGQEKEVYNEIMKYIQSTHIDCIIVTTNDLGGFTIDAFISNFYNYNDFQDVGVAFLLSTGERQSGIYMKVFGDDKKVLGYYDNLRMIQILRSVNAYFTRKDYFASVNTYLKGLKGFYGASSGGSYEVQADGTVVRVIPWLELIVLAISLTFIFILIFLYRILRKTTFKYRDDLEEKINKDTLQIKLENENYLGVFEPKKK